MQRAQGIRCAPFRDFTAAAETSKAGAHKARQRPTRLAVGMFYATARRFWPHPHPTLGCSAPRSVFSCAPRGASCAGLVARAHGAHRTAWCPGMLPRRTICRRQEPRWQRHEQCQTADLPRSGALRLAHAALGPGRRPDSSPHATRIEWPLDAACRAWPRQQLLSPTCSAWDHARTASHGT